MSSRLTARPSHHRDDWTVISTDSDDGDTDKVTYSSKNTCDGRQFEAVSPPNSIHAKELAELAMLVQSNQRRRGHKESALELPVNRQAVARIASVEYQNRAQAPKIQHPAHPTNPRDDEFEPLEPIQRSIHTEDFASLHTSSTSQASIFLHPFQASPADSSKEEQYQAQQKQYAVVPPTTPRTYISDLQTRRTRAGPLFQAKEIYKYETDDQTGYQVVTRTGEIKVSAPVGSSEANAFDGVVEKMPSEKGHRHRHRKDRRVERQRESGERDKKRIGWW